MIEIARTWRGLDKLVVTVVVAEQARDEEVKLGIARGRWRRVALQLGGLDIIAARGYQDGQLIGTWELPTEPEPELDEVAETPAQQQHRHHTRWVMEEMRKIYESQQRLMTELVTVVVEIVRTFKPAPVASVPTPETQDEAATTLRMLLGAAMMNKGGSDDEKERDEGRKNGDAGGPTASPEQDGVGA